MAIMVLVRGLPCSGKTTYAQVNFASQGFKHIEIDMFFTKNGVFKYEPGRYEEAAEWCQRKAIDIVKLGQDIVVSNVFLRHWEMGFYLQLAEKHGYEIIVHTCQIAFKCKSSYPQKVLNYMQEMFEV